MTGRRTSGLTATSDAGRFSDLAAAVERMYPRLMNGPSVESPGGGFVEELPRNPTGKVLKRLLRERFPGSAPEQPRREEPT